MAKQSKLSELGYNEEGKVNPTAAKLLAADVLGYDSNLPTLSPEEGPTPSKKFTPGYIKDTNLMDHLAENQNGWDQFGNVLAQTAVGALTGTVETVSYMADLEQHLDKLNGQEQEYRNWLSESMQSLKESNKELFPVYLAQKNEGFSPDSSEWWAHHGGDTVGTLLGLMVPGLAVGKAAKLAGLAERGQAIASTVASRYAESTMEANQVFEDSYQKLVNAGVSEDEAKKRAGASASKAWNTNWLFALQDYSQFKALATGFKSASKGAKGSTIKSVAALAAQPISEGIEEGGQFITSAEATAAALDLETDYFGVDFSKRLPDYVHDEDFKTSVTLGAAGGGVFAAAGKLAEAPIGKGVERLNNIVKRGLGIEKANSVDDTGTSQKYANLTAAEQMVDRINKGTLNQYITELAEQAKEAKDPQGRLNLQNQAEDAKELMTLQTKLKNNPAVPETLHKGILLKQLERNQLVRLDQHLTKEVETLEQDLLKTKELTPELLPLKKLIVSAQAYEKLAEVTKDPKIAKKAAIMKAEAEAAIKSAKENSMFTIAFPDLDKALTTTKDDDFNNKTFQTIATREKTEVLNEELKSLTTKEGVVKQGKIENEKMRAAQVDNLIARPDVTKKELELFKKTTDNPVLLSKLDAKIAAINAEVQEKNKQETEEVVKDTYYPEETFAEGPPEDLFAELPPDEMTGELPPDVEPGLQMPPDFSPDTTMLEAYGGAMSFNQAKKLYGIEYANSLLEKLQSETPQEPKPSNQTQQKQDIKAQKAVVEVNTVPVWLKVRSNDGTRVKYYDNANQKYIDITEVFASDEHGNLLIDTPAIKTGERILLKVVSDGIGLNFPYTYTPGFKPKEGEINTYVINGYQIDENGNSTGKPLFQLASVSEKNPNPEGLKLLRDKVIKSATGTFLTTITKKTVGDFRKGSGANSLEVLGFDYDANGKYGKTPTNPVLVVASYDNNLKAPNLDTMAGVNATVKQEVETVLALPRPNDLSPGGLFTPRRAPDGSLRLALLKPRKLVEQELTWLKQNIAQLLASGNKSTLNEVLYVPEHFSSFLTGTKKKPTPDILKASRRRVHLIETTKNNYELAVPVKNKVNGWIILQATGNEAQLQNFIERKPFKFDIIDEKGVRSSFTGDSAGLNEVALKNIYDSFENLLNNSFRNVKEENINSEIPYTDPVSPTTRYDSFYEYIVKTNAVQTDLPGSKTMASGEDSSYSVENTAAYLDAQASQEQVIIQDDEITHTETTPVPVPENPTKPKTADATEEYYGLTRKAVAEGYEIIGDKELEWFKDTYGDEFLAIAKGVDRIMATGGVEAFGVYHNALVTIADYAETGTLYHEAFHLVFDPKNGITNKAQRERILNQASKIYGIERSYDKTDTEKLRPRLSPEEYFAKRYNPVTKYTGPRKKADWKAELESLLKGLQAAYANKKMDWSSLATEGPSAARTLPPGGTVIPITIKFLKNIQKNSGHSTSLEKPFNFKDANPKENEILGIFYEEVKAELKEAFGNRPLPKAIPNERLIQKLSSWLQENYGIRTLEAPKNERPYGFRGIFNGQSERVKGGEVFIADQLHFPTIATGHSKKLQDTGVTSNTLGWFIETFIHKGETLNGNLLQEGNITDLYDLFMYEFQSDILPEVNEGQFKFKVTKKEAETSTEEATYFINILGENAIFEIKPSQLPNLREKLNEFIDSKVKTKAESKLSSEKVRREYEPLAKNENIFSITTDFLRARGKLSFLNSLLTTDINNNDRNILYKLAKAGVSFEAIMSTVQHVGKAPVYKTEEEALNDPSYDSKLIEYQGYLFDRARTLVYFNTLVNAASKARFESRPNRFKAKASLSEYRKAVKKIQENQAKNKISAELKKEYEKSNPGFRENYYNARRAAMEQFFEADIANFLAPHIDAIEQQIKNSILEQESGEALTAEGMSAEKAAKLQADYEHWYKIMFEKFIKIAFQRAIDSGYKELYFPTYASMKAIEGSAQTGRIYTAPQENRDEKWLQKVLSIGGHFSIRDDSSLTGLINYRVIHSEDSTGVSYTKNGDIISQEEYETALKKESKQFRVGPFYAALSKIKGVNVVGLEQPSWSSKPLLKIDLSNYEGGTLERFRAVSGEAPEMTNDIRLEERLAEDFRAYMLSGGKKVPQVAEAKGFFEKLWRFIKSLIGMKSPIERLFRDIATNKLTKEERAAIKRSPFYQAAPEKYRLLPKFKRYTQQTEAIMATAQSIIDLARAEALTYDKDFTNLLVDKKKQDAYFAAVKEKFQQDYNRIQEIPEAERSLEDKVREDSYKAMGVIGEGWDTVPGTLQPEIGFKDEVIRMFAKWGFRVNLDPRLAEDNDSTDEDINEEVDEVAEHVHGIDHTLVSPAKGLTTRIKLFLSTIPEPEIVNGKAAGFKKTVFGTPKYIDFNRAYANLSGKLAGSAIPLTKLEDLAGKDPISSVIFGRLAEEIKAGNTKLQTEFNTKFNLYTYQYTTAQIGYGNEGPFAKTLETNRGSIKRDIISRWREEAVRKNLIETDGTIVMNKATALAARVEKARVAYETGRKAKTPVPFEQLKSEFLGILTDMGVTIPKQVWESLEQKGDQIKRRTLFDWFFNAEKNSLKNFLNAATTGATDPFDNAGSILGELAAESKNYVDDITGSQFLNEFGNQVYATNTPSYLTEFITKANSKDLSLIEKLQQDNFFKDNRFLNHLSNNSTSLEFISALRVGDKEPKDFEKRTPADSAIARLTYYFNNQKDGKVGKFFVGTFSDKTKQAVIGLPKFTTTATAYNFLTSVLKRTILEESQRIQKVKQFKGITEMQAYKRGEIFLLVPELNSIPGLADSLFLGETNPQAYQDALTQADEVIKRFIANEYSRLEDFMVNKGLVSRTGEGKLVNEKFPEAVVTRDIREILQEFFYNDLGWRIEMAKAFMGDPAFYKSNTDYYKRQYQLVTPGVKAFNNPEAPVELTRAIYSKVEKINTDEYIKELSALVGKDIAENYRKVNKTDAQSLITVHGYRKIATAQGIWSKEMEDLYQFAWKDGLNISKAAKRDRLTPEQTNVYRRLAGTIALQPLKPFQYNDRELTLPDRSKVMIKEQFKDSMTVLIPEFAERHMEYNKLLKYMTENQVDIMSAEDTCKVGLYGVVPNDLTQSPVKRVVSLSDIRFPQAVPDGIKESVSGTQFNKKITSNIELKGNYKVGGRTLTGQELINEWNALWEEKIKGDSQELRDLLGLDESFTISQDPKKRNKQLLKIKTVLEQQLLARDLSDNLSDALDLVQKTADSADFTLQLGFPTHAKKFATVLSNLFKKAVIKQKSPGFPLVNFADYGISTTAQSSNLNFVTNSDGQLVEAEIGMPVSFFKDLGLDWIKNIDPLTNKIRWESLNENQKEALQLIAYRIPTSDKSSMVPVRVAMVIPPSMGNVVMVPGELTIQQGLDFDVDKTQLLRRELTKEGKIDKDSISNKLFDISWGVLTNKEHYAEMLKPLSSPTLKAIKDGYGIQDESGTSLLSTVSDMEAEEKNKHAKRMIGIFSRFSTAHDLLQTITDYVYVSSATSINITSKNDPEYRFDKLGRKYDDKGVLISGNISEDQSAALDAAKDPILADLNVTTVTAPLKGYMTLMGVNMQTISDFMMQPVLREWMRHYNIEDSNPNKALEALLAENPGIATVFTEFKEGKRYRQLAMEELENPMEGFLDDHPERQALVLFEFTKYMSTAALMSKINNVLSVDTLQDMTGVEAIQSLLNQVADVTNGDNSIFLSDDLFDVKKAPKQARRLAAFYQYGVYDALTLANEFFPYGNTSYKQAQNYAGLAMGLSRVTDKELLATINNFMDFYMFEGNGKIGPVLNKLAPNYSTRWKFLSTSASIWKNVESLIAKYPSLKQNDFIASLRTYPSKKDGVQMIGLTNTNKNVNKTRITQGWWTLMTSVEPEIRTLAVDLVRFSIYTSGFGFNTKSFTDVIPVQFWVQNGLAEEHKALLSGLLPNESGESATRIDSEGFTRNFVRHAFMQLEKFPEVYYNPKKKHNLVDVKANNTHVTEFTLPKSHPLNAEGRGRVLPSYIRMWDDTTQKYRLYEGNPANKLHFKEIQPLGEPKSFFEVTYTGDKKSQHPLNQDAGTPTPFHKPASITTFPLLGEDGINPFLTNYISSENMSVEEVLNNLIEKETDIELKDNLQRLLMNVDKVNNIPVQLVALKGKLGQLKVNFIGDNAPITALQFNPNGAVESDSQMRIVIAHELNHAYSVGVLTNPVTAEQQNFAINIERIRKEAVGRLGQIPGLENRFEFIARLATEKEFRAKLKKTDLWSRILRFFRKLLGMKESYEKVLDQYYSILDNTEELQDYKEAGMYPFVEKAAPQRKRISTLEQMLSTLKAREDRLWKQGKKIEATQTGINIETLEELAKNKKNQALARYILTVDEEVASLKKAYAKMAANPDKINSDSLWHVIEQLQSYDILDSLGNQLRLAPEDYAPTKEASEVLLKQFDTLRGEVGILTQDVKRLRIRRAAEIIKETSKDSNLTIESLVDQLEIADRDITWSDRNFDAGIDTTDGGVQAVHRMIKNADAEANRLSNKDVYSQEAAEVKVVFKVRSQATTTYGEEIYDDQGNPKLFWKPRVFYYKPVGLAKATADYELWLRSQGKSIGSVLDKNKPIIDLESLKANSNGVQFIDPASQEGKAILSIKKTDKNYPLRQYYETIVLGYLHSQEKIKQIGLRPGLRVPSIQRGIMEAVTSEGFAGLAVIKEKALDSIRRRYDETDFRAVDESGKPMDYLPVRFISKQDGENGRISTKEVSLDVATTVGVFMAEMHRYSEMEKILADVELIKGQLEDRKVVDAKKRIDYPGLASFLTRERTAVSDPETGLVQTKPGAESNAFRAVEMMTRRLMYGQMKKDAGEAKIAGVRFDVRKTVDTLIRFTGMRMLLGNFAIPLTNLAMGELTMLKEAIGGNFITRKQYVAGQKLSASVANEALADMGRREKKTKFGRVFMYFNPMDNARPVNDLGVDTNWMRTVLPKIARGLGDMAEFKLASTALGAVLNRFPAVNAEGKEVSLYEALKVEMNGSIGLEEGYTYKGKKVLTSSDINEVRDYVLRFYQFMNGNYNQMDSAGIKETIGGDLVLFMRNWLVPGFNTRWQLKRYDERFQQEIEGHYISALVTFNNLYNPKNGFFKGTLDSLRVLTWMGVADEEMLLHPNELALPEDQKTQLIEMRKANIRKSLVELYLIAGISVILMLALGGDEDDDSYPLYMLARIRREMMTFLNPMTAWDVLRSPTVAMRTISDLMKVTYHGMDAMGALATGEELDRYKSGPGKGDIKILHDLKPILALDQLEDLDTKIRLITRGQR